MIKVKQFYSEMTYDNGGFTKWEETTTIDKYINDFLESNKNIKVIDIKYALGSLQDTFQSSALLIYEEEDGPLK